MRGKQIIKKFPQGQAAAFLPLCLFSLAFFGIFGKQGTVEGNSESINITSVAVSPSPASLGEEIEFSGEYSSVFENESYRMYICKSKKFNSQTKSCSDGYWCDSSEYASDNPLKCNYKTQKEDSASNRFYAFICSLENGCSSPFSEKFTIQKNVLDISAPEKIGFNPMQFSFEGRENSGNALGKLTITASSPGNSDWSVNANAQDWQSEEGDFMDFDGDGKSFGRLHINMDSARIESSSTLSGIIMGKTDSFSSSVRSINIVTASKKNESGVFDIEGIKFDQFVPGNQKEGIYTTVLTFTIS